MSDHVLIHMRFDAGAGAVTQPLQIHCTLHNSIHRVYASKKKNGKNVDYIICMPT